MGAGGSIPADEAAAKEAGKTDEEILLYKASQGYKDGTAKDYCAEGAELCYPGAPPFPVDFMMGITTKFAGAFPDWKSQCLSITKNDDGTYTCLEQQIVGAMKADMPAIEGTPFPEVKLAEIPEEAKVEIVFPVEVTTYTLEGGKIKKIVSAGETKEGVEGQVAEITPYMKEQWAAGNGGFGYFSAVCWIFGREVFDALGGKVPVGLINNNWGGTPVESWTTPETLACISVPPSSRSLATSPVAAFTKAAPPRAAIPFSLTPIT